MGLAGGESVTELSLCFVGLIATAWAIRILAPLVVLSLPLRLAARLSLRRELRRIGIRHLIPRACMVEIADAASRSHASLAEKLNWSLLLVKDRISTEIERDARAIRDWLYGASAAGLPEYLTAALQKHGVGFGLLTIGNSGASK